MIPGRGWQDLTYVLEGIMPVARWRIAKPRQSANAGDQDRNLGKR